MNQESGNATNDRTSRDIKLCGCSRHTQHLSAQTTDFYRQTQDSSGTQAIEITRHAIDSTEHVLVFGSEDQVTLEDVGIEGKIPFFASLGFLTDFNGNRLPGSKVLAALPVDLARLGDTLQWPPLQPKPFGKLPVVYPNKNDVGFARNSFDFGDGSSLVSVGAAIAKTHLMKDGSAMFWVVSCQVITQGTGKYEGARGIESFSGSSFFPKWPASPKEQVKLLVSGFKARIHRCIKIVLKKDAGS